VTELLLEARSRCDKGSAAYLDLKLAIGAMMGWRSPHTIEVYDHSLDRLEALGVLRTLQEAIRDRGQLRLRAQADRLVPPVQGSGRRPRATQMQEVAAATRDEAAVHTWFAARVTRPHAARL
jgi:hypothetical protein